MTRRSFARNDSGVTEVIGYVLSFAISAVFLLIALNVFHTARSNTEEVVTGVELKTIADEVAANVVELGLASQEFPNATLNLTLSIPQTLSGRLYHVNVSNTTVRVSTNDGMLTGTATTYKVDALQSIYVVGQVDSSNERIRMQYKLQPDTTRMINIRGE